jgi:hypothetical protein
LLQISQRTEVFFEGKTFLFSQANFFKFFSPQDLSKGFGHPFLLPEVSFILFLSRFILLVVEPLVLLLRLPRVVPRRKTPGSFLEGSMPPKKTPKTPATVATSSSSEDETPQRGEKSKSGASAPVGASGGESKSPTKPSSETGSRKSAPQSSDDDEVFTTVRTRASKKKEKAAAKAKKAKEEAPKKPPTPAQLARELQDKEAQQAEQRWNLVNDDMQALTATTTLESSRADVKIFKNALGIPIGMSQLLRHLTLNRDKKISAGLRKPPGLPNCWQPGVERIRLEYNPEPKTKVDKILNERLESCIPTVAFSNRTDIPYIWICTVEDEIEAANELNTSLNKHGGCALAVEAIPWGPATRKAAFEKHIPLPRYKFILIVTHMPRVYVYDCLALDKFKHGLPDGFADLIKRHDSRYALFGPQMTADTTFPLTYPVVRFDTLCTYIFRGAQEGDHKPTDYDLGSYSKWKWGYDFRPGKICQERFIDKKGEYFKHPDTYGHVEKRNTTERRQSSLIETEELLEFKLNWASSGYINGYLNNVGVTMWAAMFQAMKLVNHDRGYREAMLHVCRTCADRTPELLIERFSGAHAIPEGFRLEDYYSSSSARTSASKTPSGTPRGTPQPEADFMVVRKKVLTLQPDGTYVEEWTEERIPKVSYSEVAKSPQQVPEVRAK